MTAASAEGELLKAWRDLPMTASATAYADEDYRLLVLGQYLANSAKILALLGSIFNDGDDDRTPADLRKLLGPAPDRPARREEIDAEFQAKLVNEMVLCRFVDNFLSYIAGLLTEVFKQRPEALRSKETLTWEYVLDFGDMTALRHALAELKVERLAYSGVSQLAKKLEADLNLELFTGEDLPQISLAVEMRNLIVHNRGIVNERSASRAPELKPQVGERVSADNVALRRLHLLLLGAVRRLDALAIDKFALGTTMGWVQPHVPGKEASSGAA